MNDTKFINNYAFSANALNARACNDYYYGEVKALTVCKNENNVIEFKFYQKTSILSPEELAAFGNARFDYKDILKNSSRVIKYKFVIAQSENIFLLIDLSYKNDIKIEFFEKERQTLSFSSSDEIDFSIYLSDTLNELIKKNVNQQKTDDFDKTFSVIIDYKKFLSNNMKISEIKKTFPNFTDSITIKNWNGNLQTDEERRFLENIFQKTSINDIGLLIFYDDTIRSAKNDETIYIKNIKEDYVITGGRKICDLVSKEGGKVISDNLSALSKYCDGIVFLPYLVEYNKNIDNLQYLSFRTETSVEQFYNNLRLYYISLNSAVKGRIFVKNLLAEEIPNLRKIVSIYTDKDLTNLKDCFIQGYCDLDLIVEDIKKITNKSAIKNIYLFSLLFSNVFVDYKITVGLNKKFKLFNYFEKVIKLKKELSTIFDIFYYNLKNFGRINLDYIIKNNKLFGFIINSSCAFVNTFSYILKKIAYIPEGEWFDIENSVFLTEGWTVVPKDIELFVLLKINNALVKKVIRSKLMYNYEIIIYADKDFDNDFFVTDRPNPGLNKIKLRYDEKSVTISFNTPEDIQGKSCNFRLILNKNINKVQINKYRISFKQIYGIIYFEYNKLQYENTIELS
ncbi:MAG: hypothetical protein BWX91_02283 [Spirochaetes bacterium ADurb.Bin133]|jgi:hypothetical protein|nr:MAG: hypothetical protein BWX91_02283 [Spirochaetes bacterium ADurb.Bin133]